MPHYKENELLQHLRDCKNKHGKVNTNILNNDDEFPSGPTYGYRFDSFAKALEEADLHDEASKARRRTKKTPYSKNEVIEYLKEISEDGLITNRMIVSSDGPTVNTILRKFSIDSINKIENYTDEIYVTTERERKVEDKRTVTENLKRVAKENNKVTKNILNKEENYPSIDDINYHYGSLEEAADELGIDIHGCTSLKSIEPVFNSIYIYVVDDDGLVINYTSDITNKLSELSQESVSVERIVRVKENVMKEVAEIEDSLSNYEKTVENKIESRKSVEGKSKST